MTKSKGGIFLALFGSVFLAVGLGVGVFLVRSLEAAKAMLAWDETEAVIVACDLERHSDSDGGSTYKVTAQYTYSVDGREYSGDRVSLSGGSDNIGSFHQDTYRRLKKAADSRQPVKCYVNPRNHQESILVREPRAAMILFKLIFVFAFGAAGLGLSLSGLLMLLMPDTSADDFRQARIRMRGAGTHRVAIAVAIYWNLFGLWALVRVLQIMTPAAVPLYLWAICLTGVFPLVVALYLFGRVRKYGISYFEMSPMPGALGGPVSGNVRIPVNVQAEEGFDVELQCIHQYTTRSGKNSTTHRDVLWEFSVHVNSVYSYGTETIIPVNFRVPGNVPATSCAGNQNGHYWQLKVEAKTAGIDYNAVFDVPVKWTSQSGESVTGDEGAHIQDSVCNSLSFEQTVRQLGLGYELQPDGVVQIRFSACRGIFSILFLLVFAAIWTGTCVFMAGKAPKIMVAVFIFFDVLLVLGLVNMIFISSRVMVDQGRRYLTVVKRFAGLPFRSRKIDFSEVDCFDCTQGMQSGSTVYYRIAARLVNGKSVGVGGMLKGRSGAQRVVDELNRMVR